jgi:hypothetical protein
MHHTAQYNYKAVWTVTEKEAQNINEIDHISHSQLSMWEKCPRAWEYRYIQKIGTPKSYNLFFGDVYHHGLEHFYIRRMQGLEDYTPEEMAEIQDKY